MDNNTNTSPSEAVAALAAESRSYREAMAAAMTSVKNAILIAQIGHGTTVAAIEGAMRSGSRDVLFIMPKGMLESVMPQLESIDIKPAYSAIRDGKGGAARMCGRALRSRNDPPEDGMPRVWIAAVNQAAEIGNWHDAWKNDLKHDVPFDFMFVFDATAFTNAKSERGRGIRLISEYTNHAVLFYDEQKAESSVVKALSENFGTPVRPVPHRMAANACEAMCMDD